MKVYIEKTNQVKRELAKTYQEFKEGKLKSEEAKTRVYILRSILEADYKEKEELRIIEAEKRENLFPTFT
jgi:hypothetical protein